MARRMLSPDGAIRQHEVRDPSGLTRRYSGDGIVTVSDADARVMAQNGYVPASLSGVTSSSSGRRCSSCGFGSWFVTCSRCGGECVKS